MGITLAAWIIVLPSAPPDWSRDLAPLFSVQCTPCHSAGSCAPFALENGPEVRRRAQQVLALVEKRQMPPWSPEPSGEPLIGLRRWTEQEVDLLRRWVEAGAPITDDPTPREAAGPPHRAEANSAPTDRAHAWPLGIPDVVQRTHEPYTVPAEGTDLVRTFVIRLNQSEPLMLRAIDLRCSSTQVIHQALFTVDPSGTARQFDDAEPGAGYALASDMGIAVGGALGSWSCGRTTPELPPGYAWFIPAGSDLSVEVHLHPIGRPEPIEIEVALYRASGSELLPVTALAMGSITIDIPPGESAYTIRDEVVIPAAARLLAVVPTANALCREVKMEMIRSDGAAHARPLLAIKQWIPAWHQAYRFVEPIQIERGTRVALTMKYDNSSANPRNPFDPPRRIQLGHGADSEQASVVLLLLPQDPAAKSAIEAEHRAGFIRRIRERDVWYRSQPGIRPEAIAPPPSSR